MYSEVASCKKVPGIVIHVNFKGFQLRKVYGIQCLGLATPRYIRLEGAKGVVVVTVVAATSSSTQNNTNNLPGCKTVYKHLTLRVHVPK